MDDLDSGKQTSDLFDPSPLPREDERPPLSMNQVLETDLIKGPAHMFDNPESTLGTEPIDAARYYDPDFAANERDKMWMKVWQMACWSYDIPNPGDIHVYRLLDKSVLIVRQRDGSLKAFINACLHRGRELCEAHSQQNELKCPYHYFTWGLDGDIKWVPSKWDFPQVDEADFSLAQVQLDEWNGFVFINFDLDASSLQDHLGQRWISQWEGWDFHKRYKAVHVEKHINCNWKTGQEAFIEGFHAFASHSQGAVYSAEDSGKVDIFDDAPNMSRMILPLGIPSGRIDPCPDDADVFAMIAGAMLPKSAGEPGDTLQEGENLRRGIARVARKKMNKDWGIDTSELSETEALDAISYFMFPNFMPWGGLSYPLVYRFRPAENGDPAWCIWETMLFHPFEGERPPSPEKIVLGPDDPLEEIDVLGGLALVLHQDAVQLPAVQRGMKNIQSGKLAVSEYQELRIRHMHKILDEYLNR